MANRKGHYGEDFGHDGKVRLVLQDARAWMADIIYKSLRKKGPDMNNYYGYDPGAAQCPYKVEPKQKPEIAF